MENWHLLYDHEMDSWRLYKSISKISKKKGILRDAILFTEDITKEQATKLCAVFLNSYCEIMGRAVSLKIHNMNGQFEEERTYPRSADPEESKG